MDYAGFVDPEWFDPDPLQSSVPATSRLHLNTPHRDTTENNIPNEAFTTAGDGFVWDPGYTENQVLPMDPSSFWTPQQFNMPNVPAARSSSVNLTCNAPSLSHSSVPMCAPGSSTSHDPSTGFQDHGRVNNIHRAQSSMTYLPSNNAPTQRIDPVTVGAKAVVNGFCAGLSSSQSAVTQLRSIVDSLQEGGRLDDMNRLKLQLLEKDLIISELRDRLSNAEQQRENSRRTSQQSQHSQQSHRTSSAGHRLSSSQIRRRNNPDKVVKVRSAFNELSRQETAVTRKFGACLNCRNRKERCRTNPRGLDDQCMSCALANAKVYRMPCIRTRVTQVSLYHTVTTENDTWTMRPEIFGPDPTDLSTAIHNHRRVVQVTQDYGNALHLSVSEFIPVEGDETSYSWTTADGEIELPMPCYAITNIPDTKGVIETYMDNNLDEYISYFLGSAGTLIWETFQIARRRARLRSSVILCKIFSLWIASRMVEKAWRVCGTETLGLTLDDTAGTPYQGKIPIPPVMDSQFDQIVIRSILNPLRTQVLMMLNTRINRSKREDWFETYLVIFILLNSIELSTAHDHKFAKLHGHVSTGRGSRFEDYSLVENYFHSAQVLIAHFREAANGHIPLLPGWAEKGASATGDVDAEETAYLEMVRGEIKNLESSVLLLRSRHRYESLLYWCHQMFYRTWDSAQVYIQELDEGEAEAIGSY